MQDYEIVDETTVKETEFSLSLKDAPKFICNSEEYFKTLDIELKRFDGIEITQDTVKEGKSTVAKLNKVKALIDDRRKAIKNEMLAAYKPYEDICKTAIAKVDKYTADLNRQLDVFEQKRIEEKRNAVWAAIETVKKDFCNGLPEEKLNFIEKALKNIAFNDSWLNATATMKSVRDEFSATLKKISDDHNILTTMYGNNPMALSTYIDRGNNIQEVMRAMELYKQMEKETHKTEQKVEAKTEQTEPEAVSEPTEEFAFTVTATRSQINRIIDFLKSNGIKGKCVKSR